MRKALTTGITNQDGPYLAEFLSEKGYGVYGMIRRPSVDFKERITHLEGKGNFHLHYGGLSDSMSLIGIINKVMPDGLYNLMAQSHVQVSSNVPEYSGEVDAIGVTRIFEAVRQCGLVDTCRIYQASTPELHGKVEEVLQNEKTPFHPYSPHAVAKQYGSRTTKEYREAYNMFCCSGILFSHESERRGETLITRKITLAAARIKQGKQDKPCLSNSLSLRDWGHAKDYVECMWSILQNNRPEDFVMATGTQHSVREFCQLIFHYVGIELRWEGEGLDEKEIDQEGGEILIEIGPDFYRPTDVADLWGDSTKARTGLGWNPTKVSFEQLVKLMVDHDMEKVAVKRVEEHTRCNLAEYPEKDAAKQGDKRTMMEKYEKTYVVGHRGMVGSAIVRELRRQGHTNIIMRTHQELNLCRQEAVRNFSIEEKPEYVFPAVARVGGIVANESSFVDFMYDNMILEMNVTHSAWKNGCRKLEFLGPSCIYPRMALQPMKESCLLTSELEKTNEAYTPAKISGLKYCEFLNRQYGTDYISAMPTNLYGLNDNYHPTHSHVFPALIRRFHEAKAEGRGSVTCWGDKSPLWELLYVDGLADLCVFLTSNHSGNETVNAGTGKELTIKELTELVTKVAGYTGEILWDTPWSSGPPRKLLDASKAEALGWRYKIGLEDDIRLIYKGFLNNLMRAER